MAEAVLGTHDDWQIGKTKIFLKVSTPLSPGCLGGREHPPWVVSEGSLQSEVPGQVRRPWCLGERRLAFGVTVS